MELPTEGFMSACLSAYPSSRKGQEKKRKRRVRMCGTEADCIKVRSFNVGLEPKPCLSTWEVDVDLNGVS